MSISVCHSPPIIGISSIHQTTETSNFDSQILRNESGDLLGRPTDSSSKHSRAADDIPTNNYLTHGPWFHHETSERLTVTNANNCVPRGQSSLQEDDHCSSSGQTQQLKTECKEFVKRQASSIVVL